MPVGTIPHPLAAGFGNPIALPSLARFWAGRGEPTHAIRVIIISWESLAVRALMNNLVH
jgi:hypothetical protein